MDPDAGKYWRQKRRGGQRMRWLDGITNFMDVNLTKLRDWWRTGKPGVLQSMGSQRVRHDWATELNWTQLCQVLVAARGSPLPHTGSSITDSLVVVCRLSHCRVRALGTRTSVVEAPGLSCLEASGIVVPQPRIKPKNSALQDGLLPIGSPGKSHCWITS